jgi:SAM-dependent methyltransferase
VSFEIARRTIETYSQPGDLVLDPLCTKPQLPVVLEAIQQQRNAAAVIGHDADDFRDYDQRITAARADGAAVLLRGDPTELPRLLAEQADGFLRRHRQLDHGVAVHPGGSVDLILVFLSAVLLHGQRQEHTRRWRTRFDAVDLLAAAAVVLRPGGYLVAVTNSDELHGSGSGSGRDLGSETVLLCERLGLRYWQHIVALLVPINGGQLKPPRRRRRRGVEPTTKPRVVHRNVHVFRKPTADEARADSQTIDTRRAA